MRKQKKISRRGFMTGAAAAAVSLGVWRRAYGANESLRVAVVGFNGRGKDHISGYLKLPSVRLAGLCDVDSDVLHNQAKHLEEKNKLSVETYGDLRKLLENKDIDAISIATPNHQHSIMAIWAMQAGKDVYCEKPISHNVWEGRKVVECQEATKRICACGTQSRSNPGLKQAVEYIQSGKLGKIIYVRGLCYKPRQSIGKVSGEQPIPKNIDYDLWCGPARKLPLLRSKLHYDWHWQWEYGNGDVGNQGIHQMDIARWVLGEKKLSPGVISIGGRFGYVDDGETPNTLLTYHDYKPAPLIFEVRGLPSERDPQNPNRWGGGKDQKPMDNYKGASIGVIVKCEGGELVIPTYSSATSYDKEGKVLQQFKGEADHFKNFVEAVRDRKQEALNAPIYEGHISSGLCHTGNISLRVGAALPPDEIREKLKANPTALEIFESINTHLKKNMVDLSKTAMTFGEHLAMNPETEQFDGNPQASKLLTREYRAGFTIPEKF